MSEISISPAARQEIDLEKIIKNLRQKLPQLTEHYQVESLGVFGSHIHGTARSDSDLDLLVTFYAPPNLFEFIALENYLTDELGISVDLVMKTALKPRIGEHILKEVIAV
jgi:hypothetical protein